MRPQVLASRAVKICIDHHLEPVPFADHYVIDDDATSTGEITFRLLEALGGPDFSPAVATALYTAIMTDTGSFRFPRVDAETHRMAAHLIERGADPVSAYAEVYERWSPGRIHLLGAMLEGLTTDHDGRLAWTCITQEMLKSTRTTEEDTDNFTTYPMSIAGVEAGILFLELPRGLKISFRSRGDVPINELAKEFGGNGHKNAAGARIENGTMEEVRPRVVAAAAKYLNKAE
jgi:phosphoesterase RecJ-like protein